MNRPSTTRKFERNSFNTKNKKELPNPSDDSYIELFPSLTDIAEQSRQTTDISSNDYKNIAALLEKNESSLESVDSNENCPPGWVSIYCKNGQRVTEYNKSRLQEELEKKQQEMEEEERYNELMKIYEEQEKRRLEDSEYAYNMGVIDHIVTTEELYEMFMEDDYVDDNDEIDCNNSEYGD